jgi:hypothetical protein
MKSDKTEMKSNTSYAITKLTEAELRAVQLYIRDELRKTECESQPSEHTDFNTLHDITLADSCKPSLIGETELRQDKGSSDLAATSSAFHSDAVPDTQNNETAYLPFRLFEDYYKRKHLTTDTPGHVALAAPNQSQNTTARACFAIMGLEAGVFQLAMTYLNELRTRSVRTYFPLTRTGRVVTSEGPVAHYCVCG